MNSMFNQLNPNTVKTVTKVLCIDSAFRENLNTTDSSNFVYRLAEPINNVVSIKLSSIEMTNYWYLFAEYDYSNIFTITCYNIPIYDTGNNRVKKDEDGEYMITPSENHVIRIPEGNYLAEDFTEAIGHYFSHKGGGLEYVGVYVNSVNSKTEFFAGANSDIYPLDPYLDDEVPEGQRFYFKVDFTIPEMETYPLIKTIGWTLGFRKYVYIVKYDEKKKSQRITEAINKTYMAYLISESSYGSSFYQYIFLELDDFQKNVASNSIISYNGEYNLSKNILGKIVISSGSLVSITDNGSDLMFKRRNYFGPVKLEKLHLKILTRFGDILNMNGNDYSITIEVEVLYS